MKQGVIIPDFVILDIKRSDHAPDTPATINHFVNQNKNYELAKVLDGIYLYKKR
jgi:hypothetical protein